MAGARGDLHGGIRGLLDLIEEHPHEVEYELLRIGLRLAWLGTERLDWSEFLTVVGCAAPDSPLGRKVNPNWWVTPEVEFMREIEYSMRVSIWMQTEDGSKGRNQPVRLALPGDEKSKDRIGAGEGFETVAAMDEFFADDPWFANVVASRN